MDGFLHTLKPIEILPRNEKPKEDKSKVDKPTVERPKEEKPLERKSEKIQLEEQSVKLSQNAIWGPLLWRILHILAEQLGKTKPALIQTDEVQKWIQMMRAVEQTMPCALCRGHYKEWLSKHPLNELALLRGKAFREEARKYVWQLHENVNTSRSVSSGIPLEKCEELYGSWDQLQETFDKFANFIQELVSAGKFKGEGFTEFRKQLIYVRKLADCI